MLSFSIEISVAGCGLEVAGVVHRRGPGNEASEYAREEGIGAQAVGSVILVLALARGVNTGNASSLIEVHPHAAHGVVHAGKNLHGRVARVVAYELLVNFQNAFEFAV